jgi:hypothetical protein
MATTRFLDAVKRYVEALSEPPFSVDSLSTITNFDRLVSKWGEAHLESKSERLIEDRMVEILSSIIDLYELATMMEDKPSEIKQLIENRMVELLPELLPTITDSNELLLLLESVSSLSESERLIEARMVKLLPELLPIITDSNQLMDMWNSVSCNSKLEQLIENRMVELLPELLPDITSFDHLLEIWKNISCDPRPEIRRLIEGRMTELVDGITSYTIPHWFILILENKNELPECVANIINAKARKLAASA